MKIKNRCCQILAGLAAALLVLESGAGRMPALGADSSVIESLSVRFDTQFGEAEEIPDPQITVTGNGCSLGEVYFRTDYDDWEPGKKVRAELTVFAEDGKIFPVSLTRSQCRVTGANFVSAKALDDSTLQVKADYIPVTVLGLTARAGWSSSGKRAIWEKVDYAPGYSLVLYGDDRVVKRLTVEGNSADLSQYMTDPDKTYYYEVKAVPVTSDQRKYLKEGEFVTSTDQEMDWYEQEEDGDGGSLKGDGYVLPDGTRQSNIWKKLSGSWYYFDGNGNRARGWMMVDSSWYYFDGEGRMQTGWVKPDAHWYYLKPDGAMATGWQELSPGVWYYLNTISDGTRGAMFTGWNYINGKWYYFYDDGRMAADTAVGGWQLGPDGAWLG